MAKSDSTDIKRHRNYSIEMLKFLAAIIIVNSHMGSLYTYYPQLATGGAIGDALFFFCSGYGLFLSKKRTFGNYYKRRIARIYPTIFSWAILSSFLLGNEKDMKYTILQGGGWFVSCIMVYYVGFWLIQHYMLSKLKLVTAVVFVTAIVWFVVFDSHKYINIYGDGTTKYFFFFGFMLMGGMMGLNKNQANKHVGRDFVMLLSSITAFYGILLASDHYRDYWQMQILSLIPLMGVVLLLYRIACTDFSERLYKQYRVFGFIGGLCLEMYIVQFSLFTTSMNSIFPLNLFIMLLLVVGFAYILRCCARLFEQLFRDENLNWKRIVSVN